jgi:hypothetical protein
MNGIPPVIPLLHSIPEECGIPISRLGGAKLEWNLNINAPIWNAGCEMESGKWKVERHPDPNNDVTAATNN